jgi:2,4-dienoyl-CoA reductase-like NADH-dependent reductase (Old Yellow Enzyme family)
MRFLREIVSGVRAATRLKIGVRLSAFDVVPYKPDPAKSEGRKLGPGIPEDYSGCLPYQYGFGVDRERPEAYDLSETVTLLEAMEAMQIRLINISAGSPYYNPHIQRPALFPPSDGYQPPEDPLIGCARQIEATAALKRRFPGLVIVGTAYSYLQEYLPHVAQWVVRSGRADAVGLGRIVLSYPELPADVLGAGKLTTNKLCRTFSDCTTAPRNGLVSGCFPLDPFYRGLPVAADLKRAKAAFR